jgi:hypothetical protein
MELILADNLTTFHFREKACGIHWVGIYVFLKTILNMVWKEENAPTNHSSWAVALLTWLLQLVDNA